MQDSQNNHLHVNRTKIIQPSLRQFYVNGEHLWTDDNIYLNGLSLIHE